MKKIGIIGTNGLPPRYGGFETLAEHLTGLLKEKYNFYVYCSGRKTTKNTRYNKIKFIYIPLKANGFQSLLYDTISTLHAFVFCDVLLILGPVAGIVLPINFLFRKKIITNYGGLNEWEREKYNWFQKFFLLISYKAALYSSNVNIADNYILAKNIEKTFGKDSIVIRYGGDHVSKQCFEEIDKTEYSFIGTDFFLCVARAQIDNNIHLLIDTFKQLENKNIVIISNWNVSRYGIEQYERKDIESNIILIPAIYDTRQLDKIRSNCFCYIHSHSRCGTAPSLVEMMFHCKPILCFDVPTNREVTANKCFYFSDSNSLKSIIENTNVIELNHSAVQLEEYANVNYRWDKIINEYEKIF